MSAPIPRPESHRSDESDESDESHESDEAGEAPKPLAVLVVGMHRSGTSAVASALGELGLRLPREDDLLGARFGNERGHFESVSLMAIGEELLSHLGGSWDDPPELPADPAGSPELRLLADRARRAFEAAYDEPEDAEAARRAVCWKDPRTAVLLPFWRQVIDRPLAAMLVARDPLEVALSLSRRNGLGIPLCLALWERYVRRSLAGARGLPVFVSVFADILGDRDQWMGEVAAWLKEAFDHESLGLTPTVGDVPFDPASRHERRTVEPDPALEKLVLPAHMQLYGELLSLRGAHERFAYEPADPESPWTTALLEERRDSIRLWRSLDWLGRELTSQLGAVDPGTPPTIEDKVLWGIDRFAGVAGQPPPGAEDWPAWHETEPGYAGHTDGHRRYPLDATQDESRYHRWLGARGEPIATSPTHGRPGLAAPATQATPEPPMFSVVVPCWRPPMWALERCISSVLTQDYASFELCLCDDGSGSAELTTALAQAAKHDPRIRTSALAANSGISAATNRAVEGATGRYVVFLDNDDELHVHALRRLAEAIEADEAAHDGAGPDIVYSDEDKIDENGRRFMPSFKPDWSPDLLLSNAYMCHVLVVRRDLFRTIGGLRSEFDGAQDYDLMLRVTEQTGRILHVPEILYHWRTVQGSTSANSWSKPWALEAGRLAVTEAVERRNVDATVEHHPTIAGSYHVHRRPRSGAMVSAIIPFRDEPALLAACHLAFTEQPGYDNFELVLVDNDSSLPETHALLDQLRADERVRVVEAPGPFDWVAINNKAAAAARGDLLLFMNNDVEARSEGWLAALVAQAERPEIGAVGARLLFPDDTIQHTGVAVGLCWGAAHLLQGLDADLPGYLGLTTLTRNFMAVTGACMMTRREVFEEMGGFDVGLPIAYNDIDYCLRLHEAGYLVVCTPLAELVHYESKSRGHSDDAKELPYFRSRWREIMLTGDPYYNPNLGRFDCHCRLPNEEDEERWATFRSMLDESSTN